jgi:hypothetical protein
MKPLAFLLLGQIALAPGPAPQPPLPVSYPFQVGERLEYAAKLGILRLGTGWMEVSGIDTVRGTESFHFEFGLEAEAPFYKSRNVLQSWTGTADLISRRFHQDLVENGKMRQRYYEIFPDSGFFRQEKREGTEPSVSNPLDDAAFFYFLRTLDLQVGKTYKFDRYFRQKMNPVVIKVDKREKMDLPDGREVSCLVLLPVVGEEGIFAPRARAQLWLTDDAQRIPVQIRSRLPFGTVTLRLIKIGSIAPQ